MENIVQYILNLKDNLSPALTGANEHAHKLESSLGSVKHMAEGIGAALGIAFGVYEVIEFGKKSYEVFQEVETEIAKIQANLGSTGEKAGMAIQDITKYADELTSKIEATKPQILDMESQLLTFPSITKDVFQQSMGLVADIAAQTNHGLSDTAIMYGKAMSSPAQGLKMMHRYGVEFTDQEKEKIKQLQASGDLIGAQKQMMDDITHSGYGGVAAAMLDAKPLLKFQKMMEPIMEEIGRGIGNVLLKIEPLLEVIGGIFTKDVLPFIEKITTNFAKILPTANQFKGIILEIKSFVDPLLTPLFEYLEKIKESTAGWLGYIEILKNIFVESIYPVFSKVWSFTLDIAGAMVEFVANSTLIKDLFSTIGFVLKGVFELIGELIDALKWTFDKIVMPILNAIEGFWRLINGYKEETKHESKGTSSSWGDEKVKTGLLPPKTGGKPSAEPVKMPKTKAEGQKTINIHVAYNAPLIKDLTLKTVNVEGGAQKIKDILTEMLVGATHDTLMVADY